jgi:uncharacterized protein
MKVVLFGASGMVGSRILNELLNRGHHVTAVVRDTSRVEHRSGLVVEKGNVLDPGSVALVSSGSQAAISAYGPGSEDTAKLLKATSCLITGLAKVQVPRFIMVGGAGSLEVAPGVQLIDAPNFPPAYKLIALAHRDALEILKKSELTWTSISPAAFIEPGARTGHFRLGTDQLLTDKNGESRISAEDFAVAVVNELENPRHPHQRFTVAY